MSTIAQLIDRATTARAKKNGDAVQLAGVIHDYQAQVATLQAVADAWRERFEVSEREREAIEAHARTQIRT